MDQWKIGPTIKRLRISEQLSQVELALRSELDEKTINKLERNQQEPLFPTIVALAEAFKMLPSEFIREIEKDVFSDKEM
ncbi:helix-turn-helix domain-containing protein [Bacillus niameyensis]|uniref:helix-turn-helix domain-containing protein n=1 Tax=Bacillus niameyensis TaxID=1522308 RepID=UPI0007833B90|nr:helix-turn-helix transcriptional regulator [Bacillus niameyensis]